MQRELEKHIPQLKNTDVDPFEATCGGLMFFLATLEEDEKKVFVKGLGSGVETFLNILIEEDIDFLHTISPNRVYVTDPSYVEKSDLLTKVFEDKLCELKKNMDDEKEDEVETDNEDETEDGSPGGVSLDIEGENLYDSDNDDDIKMPPSEKNDDSFDDDEDDSDGASGYSDDDFESFEDKEQEEEFERDERGNADDESAVKKDEDKKKTVVKSKKEEPKSSPVKTTLPPDDDDDDDDVLDMNKMNGIDLEDITGFNNSSEDNS